MRCFVAVLLDEPTRAALANAAREICGVDSSFRLISPENLHLTLQFLGEIPESLVDQVREALAAGLSGLEAMALELGGSGAFPSPRRPRVVWVGVRSGAAPLVALASAVAGSLAPLGLRPDKPFSPHVTVARARRGASRPVRVSLPPERLLASVDVLSVDLMESRLLARGAQYQSLQNFVLRGRPHH